MSTPLTLSQLWERYQTHHQPCHLSPRTWKTYGKDWKRFQNWATTTQLETIAEIHPLHLEAFQTYLAHFQTPLGKSLKLRSQLHQLTLIKRVFQWALRENHLLHDPSNALQLPKLPAVYPTDLLTPEAIELLLSTPDTQTPEGGRDRVLLELFYATAMRSHEAAQLKLGDLELESGVVWIRKGKGQKDRILPLTPSAIEWLAIYLKRDRPWLQSWGKPTEAVFLGRTGTPFTAERCNHYVRKYLQTIAPGKQGASHLIRRSVATLMLENGADICYVQELLGHQHLRTTQRYTQVNLGQLKEIYAQTHPFYEIQKDEN